MDRPGAAYVALGGEDWPELQENSRHAYTVKKYAEDREWYRTITFSPTYIACSVEWRTGVPIGKLLDREDVRNLLQAMDRLKAMTGVTVLKRAGLRVFEIDCLLPQKDVPSTDKSGKTQPRALLQRFIDVGCGGIPLSGRIAGVMGETTDVMWRQTGQHPDGGKYFISCGPFGDDEKNKFFEFIHDGWDEFMMGDFISDSDFSDQDFELKVSSKSWATPLIERHARLIDAIKTTIKE